MIRILLVEDHLVFGQALEAVLRTEDGLQVVGRMADAQDAAATAARLAADIAIVDLDLPGGSGAEVIREIRRQRQGTRCIVLSALSDDVEFGRAVEAGAAAALHKTAEVTELVDVIRAVADGQTVLPALETSRRLRALAAARNEHWYARVIREELTNREWEVLERLGEGADSRAIATELGVSVETVHSHVRNLLAKLNAGSRLEAVVKAQRLGLLDPPPTL